MNLRRMRTLYYLILSILICLVPVATFANLPLNSLQMPPGFHISIYAKDLPDVRQLALGPHSLIFAGTKTGEIYAIAPNLAAHTAGHIFQIAKDLNSPNGVAYHDDTLYVAEINKVLAYKNILTSLKKPPLPTTYIDNLPTKRWHGLRYIKFSPINHQLYISIGMPCNICLSADKRFGTIERYDPKLHQLLIVADGIRNSMGFAWSPIDQSLWFTDNGQDGMGDTLPPDEINHLVTPAKNFGFPYVYGDNHPNKDFYLHAPKDQPLIMPRVKLPAHVAPLGMTFYHSTVFPHKYRNNIIMAEHGSWNSSKKVGYQVVRIQLAEGEPAVVTPLISGWLNRATHQVWGRPVDVLQMPDGALLISDDMNGVIYRLSYRHPQEFTVNAAVARGIRASNISLLA